ncbi:MAG: hypothetical protein SPI30_02860 [Prevotella sp.]|nr:hypothetical protein [Prevotella sp.]
MAIDRWYAGFVPVKIGNATSRWYSPYQCLVRRVPMTGTHSTKQWYDAASYRHV